MRVFTNECVLKAAPPQSIARIALPTLCCGVTDSKRDTNNSKSQWVGAEWTEVR